MSHLTNFTVGSSLFLLFDGTRNFNNAATFCEDQNTTLARIGSDLEFEALKNATFPFKAQFSNIYVGIRSIESGGKGRPENFIFVDGTIEDLPFIQNRSRGEFPWNSGQPDNTNGNENCVEYKLKNGNTDLFTLNDIKCSEERRPLCRLELPPEDLPVVQDDDDRLLEEEKFLMLALGLPLFMLFIIRFISSC